ncbi:MAG: YncE family protein [Mycobacterium sp.]
MFACCPDKFPIKSSFLDTRLCCETFKAYVTSQGTGKVFVVDVGSDTPSVVKTLTVGASPFGIATYAAGNRAYVANGTDGTVTVIDTSANSGNGSVLTTYTGLPVGVNANAVAVSGDGTTIYVTNSNNSTLYAMSTTGPNAGSVVASYTTMTQGLNNGLTGLAVNPGSSTTTLYVVNSDARIPSVTIIPVS